MKALFLSHENALAPGGGGQQACNREYHESLRLAGFEMANVSFATDRKWLTRLRRRLRPSPYADSIPLEYWARVVEAVRSLAPSHVFCNHYNFIPSASVLRRLLPQEAKLVLLSHGLASVDEVHAARIARRYAGDFVGQKWSDDRIGATLRIETEGLPAFDHIFTLAPFEVEVTRWLGGRSVSWVPRSLNERGLLEWRPLGSRVGCVGTFDHPPNFEGLEMVCTALQRAGPGTLRLRVASRSHSVLERLRTRFPFVEALGPMERPGELEAEAATWSAFLHPIFCMAMGCSTKLATGMNWGLPVLTTPAGMRGYQWAEGGVSLAGTAVELARNTLEVLDPNRASLLREDVLKAVRSAPSIREVAAQMQRVLAP